MRPVCTYALISILVLSTLKVTGQVKQPLLQLDGSDIIADSLPDQDQVISVSRTLKNADLLPAEVYVISRDEILANGYISLADVLKSIPGIRVSQPGSAIDGETFLMRGLFGNYHTKILVDDIPVQPSVTGGMPIGEQLPVRQAERIEIIMGPSSAIYGADAMAGVINIITKTSERPVSAQADISLGNPGYQNLNVMIGGKLGKKKNVFGYSFFGSASNLKDHNIKYDIKNNFNPALYDDSLNYLSAPYYEGDSFSPAFDRLPGSSRLLGFRFNFRGLSLSYLNMARKTHSSIGQHTAFYSYANPGNYWAEQNQRLALKYEHAWRKAANRTTLSYLHYRLDNLSSFGIIYDGGVGGKGYKYAASDDIFFENITSWQAAGILELTGGVSFTYSGNLPKTNDLKNPFNTDRYDIFSKEIAYSDSILGDFGLNPVTYWNASAFIQALFTFNNWSLQVSNRLDYHSIYGTDNNPRLAAIYGTEKNWKIWAAVGSAFRAPSPYYSYSSLAYPLQGGIFYDIVPNPGLQPEMLRSAEAGFRWEPGRNIRLNVHAFYHVLDQIIARSIIILDESKYPNSVSGPVVNAYVNDQSSEGRLFGLKLVAGLNDIVEPVKLDIDLYVMYTRGTEQLPNDLGRLDSYRMSPPFMGQLNISLNPWGKVYIYVRNTMASSWYRRYLPLETDILETIGYPTKVDGYYTMDLITRYSFSRNLQVFFQLFNVFDAQYGGIGAYGSEQDLRYNPQYGRSFKLGFSFRLE